MNRIMQDLEDLSFIEVDSNTYLSPFRYNSAHLSYWLDKMVKDKSAEEQMDNNFSQKVKSFEQDYISNFNKENYKVADGTLYFLGEKHG